MAPIRSVLQPQVSGLADLVPVAARTGDEVELDELVERLAAAAYTRTDLVEKRGEFAVRGGIVDVFPPTEEHPVRLEFWGDSVEEIRYFKVADQRSLEIAEHGLWAPPCRELLLTEEVRKRAADLMAEHPELADILGKVSEGIAVEGMESLAPVLVDEMELLIDLLPDGSPIVLCDPERVRTRAADLVQTSAEFLDASWAAAGGGGKTPIDLGAASLRGLADVREHAITLGLPWWSLTPFAPDLELAAEDAVEVSEIHDAEQYGGDSGKAFEDIRARISDGWRIVLVTEGHGPAERLVEVLKGADIAARLAGDLTSVPEPSVVHVACGSIEHGFTAPELKLEVLTESDISGQRTATRDMSRMPSRRRNVDRPPAAQGRRPGRARAARRRDHTSRWRSARWPAPPASTSSSSTPRPSAASPATGCSSPPTSWTR